MAGPAQATKFADVSVRLSGGNFVGQGHISNGGSGQTLKAKVRPGKSLHFDVCAENQSGATNGVTIMSAGNKGKLLAAWRENGSLISNADMASGYSEFVSLGQSLCLTLKIKAKDSARSGMVRSWPITGSGSSLVSDTGMIRIKVI